MSEPTEPSRACCAWGQRLAALRNFHLSDRMVKWVVVPLAAVGVVGSFVPMPKKRFTAVVTFVSVSLCDLLSSVSEPKANVRLSHSAIVISPVML